MDYDWSNVEQVEENDFEASAFPLYEKAKWAEAQEAKVMPNLVELIVASDPSVWIPILMVHKDDDQRKLLANTPYGANFPELVREFWADAQLNEKLFGFEIGVLGKAAATAVANLVYSNDEGKADAAMKGKAMLEDGLWTVGKLDRRKNRHVISITSSQSVDMQLFCASVDVGYSSKVVQKTKGKAEIVNTVKILEKNNADRITVPVEIKRIFQSLLVLPPRTPVTASVLDGSPFLWKSIYEMTKLTEVPLQSLPLPLIFFKFVAKSFPYQPKRCNIVDVIYAPYPNLLKELTHQVAKHAVMKGGIFLNSHHFTNIGIAAIGEAAVIGGEFPNDLCYYNTNPDITWEKAGAAIESPNSGLGTKIESVRPITTFDGVWFNPVTKAPESLSNASGVIIPYDSGAKGLAWLKRWVSLSPDCYYRMWASYGPMPNLFIISMQQPEDDPDDEKSKNPPESTEEWAKRNRCGKFNPEAAKILWKTMGVMCLFNFQASLNENWIRAENLKGQTTFGQLSAEMERNQVPTRPVANLIYVPNEIFSYNMTVWKGTKKTEQKVNVPFLRPQYIPYDYIPGRWFVAGENLSEVDQLEKGWEHFQEYANFNPDAIPRKTKAGVVPPEGHTFTDAFAEDAFPVRKKAKKDDDDDEEDSEDMNE